MYLLIGLKVMEFYWFIKVFGNKQSIIFFIYCKKTSMSLSLQKYFDTQCYIPSYFFQLKYLKITGTPIVFPNLYPLTWSLCFFSWGLSFAVILSQHYLQDDFELWHSFAYYHIIAMLDGFCSLWYVKIII